MSHRKFHRQNANSQFQPLFRNIFSVSCCCKKPRKGEKPIQGFTQPLQCHSFFPTPVKQTASCKARGSHKVKRKKLLLCSAASTSSSFRGLHMPFFYLSFITYHIIPALSFPSCRAPPQFKLCRTKLCLAPLCFILLGLPRRLFVGSLD